MDAALLDAQRLRGVRPQPFPRTCGIIGAALGHAPVRPYAMRPPRHPFRHFGLGWSEDTAGRRRSAQGARIKEMAQAGDFPSQSTWWAGLRWQWTVQTIKGTGQACARAQLFGRCGAPAFKRLRAVADRTGFTTVDVELALRSLSDLVRLLQAGRPRQNASHLP